jgi:hypothetical protein
MSLCLDNELQLLACPRHGVAEARIERNPLWNGEIVELVGPALFNEDRYVVHFASGKRRTVRVDRLTQVGMRLPA